MTPNCQSLNEYISVAIKQYWELPALSDLGQTTSTLTYKDVARKIAKLHILFKETGLRPGDKIALCGKNSSLWCVAFLATVTYGAVIVPILPDFKPDNIQQLIVHADAKLAFLDENHWDALNPDGLPALAGVVSLDDFSLLFSRSKKLDHARAHLNELFGREYPDRFTPDDIKYFKEQRDELCLISYTSGSTGFSKGVMLPYRSLWSNLKFCVDHLPAEPGAGVVCMLPLAHMYGLTTDMLRPFACGNHIRILTRTPSPRILMDAFSKVHPPVIIVVPLIIEKIIRTRVFPLLEKPLMKLMLKVPFLDDKLLAKIKERLNETFGGNLQELIIGGAAINKDVEKFLRRIGFHYTVGFGMTECGPLIAYAPWNENRMASCGRFVDRMEGYVESDEPAVKPGVLMVKGDNVMLGYYKNHDATSPVLKDGWLNTGDICNIDKDGFIYIRGRDKNMILGASGQNIYPEEIEDKLNNMPYVSESLVVDAGGGRLTALIFPDLESASSQNISADEMQKIMDDNIRALNNDLPSYSQIVNFKIREEEFEKTPKRSIKRYLYKA
ncbi:MAG: AMP-binding protein [Muribaculaceae bacterium]|nr:AMP-binding protein [Muribaculaceae bacterium]